VGNCKGEIMDHRNMKIFAAYFLINEIMGIRDCCEKGCSILGDSEIEDFLEEGRLLSGALESIRFILQEDGCHKMEAIVKSPLGSSAMYIIEDEIDDIGILWDKPWILDNYYFSFFKNYIPNLDPALRVILVANFVYAPLCKFECEKECALHCNNKCLWGENDKCLIWRKHPNPEPEKESDDDGENDTEEDGDEEGEG
jgi:hypothetical protein